MYGNRAITKMRPKTLGIPQDLLDQAEAIAAEWNKERTMWEKQFGWADVARHGLRLAIEEHNAKQAKKKKAATKGQQLKIGKSKPKSKKKAPPRPKKKAAKKKAAKKATRKK